MSRVTPVLRSPCAFAALATLLAAPAPSAAQTPSPYLFVATITAKFGQIQDFVEYEHQIQEARRRTSDPRSVSAYQMQAGGPPNRFDVVIPFDDLSDLDSWPSVPELLQSAYGERDGARIYAEGSATIESVDYAVHVFQPDWSSGSNLSPAGATLTQLVTTRVRPELASDYGAYLAALKVAEDKRGIRRIRSNVTLGQLSTYTSVNQAASWAGLRADAAPPVVVRQEYGEEIGGTLLAKANAAVMSRTIVVFRLREDLSYTPD
jgi:hypothetical protein